MKPAFVLALFTAAVQICAQQLPDASELLRQSSALLKSHSSVQFTADTVAETTMPRGTSSNVFSSFVRRADDKLRTENADGILTILDGDSYWEYAPSQNQFSRISLKDYPRLSRASEFVPTIAVPGNAKVVRSEVLRVDGEPHDCWVVENREVPDDLAAVMSDWLQILWVDKQTFLPLRSEQSSRLTNVPGGRMQTSTSLRGIKFDELLEASLFEFAPPLGAADISAQMNAMLIPAPKPAQVDPPRINVAAEVPQAYRSIMRPRNHPAPEYDPSTLPYGLMSVQLLITVDSAGQVAEAEVIAGNSQLHKAARDAALRYRYNPVLRNGRPVWAYTHIWMNFSNPGASSGQEPPDVAALNAWGQRHLSLANQFRITPAQQLADLEQDIVGAPAYERRGALSEIARAALRIGDYNRALAYGEEILAKTGQYEVVSGYSTGVGHSLRGVAALHLGNLELAKRDLLDSAVDPSGVLDWNGPELRLAKELLEKGERQTVLEYFARYRPFWSAGRARLDAWSDTIRNGGVPDFSGYLNY